MTAKVASRKEETEKKIQEELDNNDKVHVEGEQEVFKEKAKQKSKLQVMREGILQQQIYKAKQAQHRGQEVVEEKVEAKVKEAALDWETINRHEDQRKRREYVARNEQLFAEKIVPRMNQTLQ